MFSLLQLSGQVSGLLLQAALLGLQVVDGAVGLVHLGVQLAQLGLHLLGHLLGHTLCCRDRERRVDEIVVQAFREC